MKKILKILVPVLILIPFSLVIAKHFWRGEIMSKEKVCKSWSHIAFDPKTFRNGDEQTRAKMACSLIENQKSFVGKDRAEIRNELGDFDGFYFSDMFPAYMIESGKTKSDDSWQLVFMLDSNEKVSEVVVHKNCCD